MYYPRFGAFLVGLRGGKQWRQADAVRWAKKKGLKALTRQVLLRIELGQIKDPAPEVLHDLATLYGPPNPAILNEFLQEKYGVDPTSHAQGASSIGGGRDSDAVALAHLRERHDALRRDVITITNYLVAITERIEQESGPLPVADPSTRTRRTRRTS